ncbi:cytochrome ubiquinol oxidase subunit I, partial [bacterium]|nr:cytochrome ubiquinol oxidase subunit I [candidate division CSSED10-310 bacterium]
MDVLILSRLQFAATTFFHFLFVPLTLGLGIMMAIMETRYVRTRDETDKRMVKFWGKIFLLNFALGVVTGIPLEFQFGTNWSRYSEFVGDIFGSILAIEASVAFFLESTFIGIWLFGWDRVSPRFHALCMWLIAIGTNISAFWILVANAWMQNPVGYAIRNGRAELTDFFAVITSRSAVLEFTHTVFGSYILASFLVMGISAWHLLRRTDSVLFTRSFRLALGFGLVFSILTAGTGHLSGIKVHQTQPAKLAAMEALWETQSHAPMTLVMWPDPENETNRFEMIKIPGLLSMLASEGDPRTIVKGLKAFPPED